MDTKKDWRRILLLRRRQLSAVSRAAFSTAIVERLRVSSEFRECGVFLSYSPIGAEVDPTGLTARASEAGKLVRVTPATGWQGDSGEGQLSSLDIPGRVAGGTPWFAVVPGVGFDFAGARLGRGGAYFDRLLSRLRAVCAVFVVGVAFEVQVVARLPRDVWDQSVDLVATERRLIVPGRGCAQRDEAAACGEGDRR